MRIPPFKGNIVVSNLPSHLTPAELASLFDDYGLVLGAKIERWHDRPGGSQGMIDLAPDTSVERAVEALDGHAVGANKISVKRLQKRAKPASAKSAAKAPSARPVRAPAEMPPASAAAPSHPFASGEVAAPKAPTRKVVVEYRPAPRRIVIPPRASA